MKVAVSYDDVLLVPRYSEIESRGEVIIGNSLDDDIWLDLPLLASPMDTVSELEMGAAIAKEGGLAIIHRYNTIREQQDIVAKVVESLDLGHGRVGAAIGVKGDYIERAGSLIDAGAIAICLDVAHGDHAMVERALKSLRDKYTDIAHFMAGNVATLEGLNHLAEWGADSVRVGIGGGSICSTRIETGHGVPTLESIFDCVKTEHDVKIIADGGIKTAGDIVKSLAAGADFVMVGSMLAGTTETPGEIYTSPNQGKKYKAYRGMASEAAQLSWRGTSASPEGISTTVPFKGSVAPILQRLRGNIASGLSYSGARNLNELHAVAKFIRQTPAAQIESSTHILNR